MNIKVTTNVSPSLHPANVTALRGYSEKTKGYVSALEKAFGDTYQLIDDVHEARTKAVANEAWTPAMQTIKVAELAAKNLNKVLTRWNTVWENLDKGVRHIESELSTPLEQQAGVGIVNGEIRSHFKSLAASERRQHLTDAISSGDVKTATAVLGAPSYLSGLSEVEHAHHVRAFHELQSPEKLDRLKIMKEGLELMDGRRGLLSTQFTKAIGADWGKVKRLKEANSAAEQAFVMSAE